MRITRDLLAGLMFCAFGIGAALVAQGYTMGTLNRMGSGFFPTMVGVGLTLTGLVLVARAVIRPESSETVAKLDFRPLFLVALAIVLFGLLIDDYGLVAALAALIIVARFGGREGSPLELAIMVVVLIAVAAAIFVYGLNIRLPLGPR